MRASLLAIATTTLLRGARCANRCTHCPNPPVSYLTRNNTDRAPWISIRRRYTLPRLLMPYSFCLPPVECCRGTTPTQAAKSRPPTKSRAIADGGHSGGGDQRAEAWDLSESPAASVIITYTFNLVGDRPDVDLDLFPLLPHALQQPAQTRAQVSLGIFDHGG